MSESDPRRVKRYYAPRALLNVSDVLAGPTGTELICITTEQRQMLINMCAYLHRRVTYVDEYRENGYLCATNKNWDDIQSVVADLEYRLMTNMCDELSGYMSAIAECVCRSTEYQAQIASRLPDLTEYVTLERVTYLTPEETSAAPEPAGTDEERCAYAQAFYAYVYDALINEILPVANAASDTVCAAIAATSTFAGIATFVGIPVAILGNVFAAVVTWGVDSAISSFQTWLLSVKDEIICIIYNNLPNFDAVSVELKDFVNGQAEPSYLEKRVLLSMLASTWHLGYVIQDQQDNGTWDAYIESGYCSVCTPVPPSCVAVRNYVVSDWDGGTVDGSSGRAVVKGGATTYVFEAGETLEYPSYLVLSWVPRSDGSATARCRFGVSIDGGAAQILGQTVDRAVDVAWQEWTNMPATAPGLSVELVVQQDAYWSEPSYFCVVDTPPT